MARPPPFDRAVSTRTLLELPQGGGRPFCCRNGGTQPGIARTTTAPPTACSTRRSTPCYRAGFGNLDGIRRTPVPAATPNILTICRSPLTVAAKNPRPVGTAGVVFPIPGTALHFPGGKKTTLAAPHCQLAGKGGNHPHNYISAVSLAPPPIF